MMQVAEVYKSWDLYGALSNFSAHPISMPSEAVSLSGALPSVPSRQWPSVEHFYQAQKFAGQCLCVLGTTGGGNETQPQQHSTHNTTLHTQHNVDSLNVDVLQACAATAVTFCKSTFYGQEGNVRWMS